MRKLIAGIHRFRKQHWSENRELYRRRGGDGPVPAGPLPHMGQWLRHGDRTMAVVAANYPELSREERYEITAEENVLLQMENLRTYPVVRKAAYEGRLHVHAWYYVIGTGTVFRYSPEKEQFEPIREEE